MTRRFFSRAVAAGLLIAVSAAPAALAQKQGGILRQYIIDSPASMSIHEETTVVAERPMMAVMNNLVLFDQHVKQNSLSVIMPELATDWAWDEDGTATAEGTMAVREVNRALGLSLPTDGPKNLNGLIVEHLQDIPEADVAIKIGNVPMEIVHAQGRTVKSVRIFRPSEPVENTETSEA